MWSWPMPNFADLVGSSELKMVSMLRQNGLEKPWGLYRWMDHVVTSSVCKLASVPRTELPTEISRSFTDSVPDVDCHHSFSGAFGFLHSVSPSSSLLCGNLHDGVLFFRISWIVRLALLVAHVTITIIETKGCRAPERHCLAAIHERRKKSKARCSRRAARQCAKVVQLETGEKGMQEVCSKPTQTLRHVEVQQRAFGWTMSSQKTITTQRNHSNERCTSEGGGRDKLKKVDGDFPACMRKMEDLKGKGGGRLKHRTIDGDVPLCLRKT